MVTGVTSGAKPVKIRIKWWQWLVLALATAFLLFNVYVRMVADEAPDARMTPVYSQESWGSEDEALQHCTNPVPVARPLTPDEEQEESWRCPR